jgi:hypothetical protein
MNPESGVKKGSMKTNQSIRLLALCMATYLFLGRASAQMAPDGGGPDSMPVLPMTMTVVLVEFEARSGNQGNQLNWSTILESNLDHYELERSTSNQPFKTIATIKAKGSGSLAVNYVYTDKNPSTGTNIYRLKMVDVRGGVKYSEHKLVNGNTRNLVSDGFRTYPNPARRGTSIHLDVPEAGAYQVRFVSLQGMVLGVANLENNHGGGLSLVVPQGLTTGVYLLEAQCRENSQHFRQKIMIQ